MKFQYIIIFIAFSLLIHYPRMTLAQNLNTTPALSTNLRCRVYMAGIASNLTIYANEHDGIFPSDDWDEKNNRPIWIQAVIDLNEKMGSGGVPSRRFKCPEDKSDEISSYDFLLANKSIKNIPLEEWPNVIILKEKDFDGSHHRVVYLDGNDKICGEERTELENCNWRIRKLGLGLLGYMKEHDGKLPEEGYDEQTKMPKWMKAVKKYYDAKGQSYTEELFKCPTDKSDSLTSFEFLLPGASLDDFPDLRVAKEIPVLLKEKDFSGSHHFLFYLNGGVEIKKSEASEEACKHQ